MAQRVSGFKRVPADLYQTPVWVIGALADHLNLQGETIWEPACGRGKMAKALKAAGASRVLATDIRRWGYEYQLRKFDFLNRKCVRFSKVSRIITNPPYGAQGLKALAFIEAALHYGRQYNAVVAMLLSVDFDSGKSRTHVFRDCPEFRGKIVLMNRITWFKNRDFDNGPSANHAWYLYDASRNASSPPPTIMYAGKPNGSRD